MPRHSIALLFSLVTMLALLGFFGSSPTALHAQISATPSTLPHPSRPGLPGDTDYDPFRNNPGMRERLERGRAADRQRRIVDDANRLVALTAQYRKALDAHGTPTDDDQKLLVQIEKLARDVKDRMRGM